MIASLREAKLSRNIKVKVCFFPGAKMKDFYYHYYLVPLLKKHDNIILHFGTNDAPYKNEEEIYKQLKSIKDFINKWHPSCKEIYISINITVREQTYIKGFFRNFFRFFRNFFLMRPDFTKAESFLNENMEDISIISTTFPE